MALESERGDPFTLLGGINIVYLSIESALAIQGKVPLPIGAPITRLGALRTSCDQVLPKLVIVGVTPGDSLLSLSRS